MTARLATTSSNNRLASKNAAGAVEKKVRASAAPTAAVHQPSRAAEGRRANKPLMEKRRRARINQSLAVLKTLILDSARLEQNTKHSKLEKADILELTVRHLQRQRTLGSAVLSKYRAGFQECAREVARFLDSSDLVTPPPNLDPAVKQRLVRHLESCVSELDLDFHLAAEKRVGNSEGAVQAEADSEARPDSSTTAPGDDNNNNDDTHLDRNHGDSMAESTGTLKMESPLDCALISRPGSCSDMLPQSCLVSASITPPIEALETVRAGANPLLSVVQVIPSRLPDGQVIFLLPSHYVQLAAAAAASSLSQCAVLPSTSNSTTTSILAWLPKTPDQPELTSLTSSTFQIKEEFESEENMTLEDQPIDFTVTKQKSETGSFRDGSCSEAGDEGEGEGEDHSPGSAKEDEAVWRPW